MAKENSVSRAVRLGLLATTLGCATTGTAIAQETNVERIEVTGSRIARADMETASPVTVIDASAIQNVGATSIDEVLQRITAASGAMTNPGINNGSGGNARIDLRGLGANRTLVLINGRRAVGSGTGAASTVDLNTIPVAMVKRVEVLKDGASAVYGTDAVSGVVNIILKDEFEGVEFSAQGGISGEGDAEELGFDLTVGTSSDRGNVVVGLQYLNRGDASQADRGFSECPLTEGDDGLFCGGSSYTPGGTIWTEDGKYKGQQDNSWTAFNDDDFYNYSSASFLTTPMERVNLTGLANYELSDSMSLFAESTYSKRWSEQQMAPQPVWFDFEYQDWMAVGDNPFETGEAISYGRRMTDIGSRDFSQVVDTFRAVVGLEGVLDNGWTWEVAYNFGRNDSVDRLANLVNMGSIASAIEDSTPDNILFNPLDQAYWHADNMSQYVYTEQNSGGSQLQVISAAISGEAFELPAGYVGVAAGIEHRKEKAWYIPDSLTSQGLANDPPVEPTGGEFDVNEAYVEFAVPLLADTFLAQQVDLSLAGRYFDYSTFGDDMTWKVGLTWRVYDELMLRGVASTAFRAPTVNELYAGKSPDFDFITYPGAQDQALVTRGGNEMLTPEEADILTLGLVYEPQWLPGFSATVDYYDIDITDAIAAVNSQYIVDLCLAPDGSGDLINTGNAVCQSSNIYLSPSNRVTFDSGLQNIGAETTSGVDLNLAYAFEGLGLDWRLGLDTTHLLEYEVTVLDDTTDYAGIITGGSGSYAEWKSNFTVDVGADDWGVAYMARYISGMDSFACIQDPTACYAPTTPSVVYHDLSGKYHLSESITLRAGINNLLDEEPPYYTGNTDSNTDPYTYDTLGRFFYVGTTLRF
ncbi:TonB-dependent receptor [Ferrimonas marina]|uniref:Iron complex outermembrane recepter protein n=1 Tax=Ferrimonas marina TaxID=299255 RepID=A0A1M5RML3_9GAMM|nr:TonB-dependent receptor [Ferrimonas marina]SHH27537.1 iron complex outermembrane recepter protein [Ferrimonas marina]